MADEKNKNTSLRKQKQYDNRPTNKRKELKGCVHEIIESWKKKKTCINDTKAQPIQKKKNPRNLYMEGVTKGNTRETELQSY